MIVFTISLYVASLTTMKSYPLPFKTRYRIVILGEDSTEAYNFILKDRAGRRMVGTSATKLQATMIKVYF